jgi:hypothetical protein
VETGSATPKYNSIRIWNQGSSLADHTAYWRNLDGFVLRVVRACAETAKSPWQDKLPQESSDVDKRAEWRVSWLRLARLAVGLSWLLIGAALWSLHGDDVPLPVTLPRWLPTIAAALARLGVLATGIALAAWGSFGILRLVWGAWVRREQKQLLARQPPGNELMPLVGIGIVVWSVVCLAFFAMRHEVFFEEDLEDLFILVFCLVVSPAFFSTWVLLILRPAPTTAQAKPEGSQLQPTSMRSPES